MITQENYHEPEVENSPGLVNFFNVPPKTRCPELTKNLTGCLEQRRVKWCRWETVVSGSVTGTWWVRVAVLTWLQSHLMFTSFPGCWKLNHYHFFFFFFFELLSIVSVTQHVPFPASRGKVTLASSFTECLLALRGRVTGSLARRLIQTSFRNLKSLNVW